MWRRWSALCMLVGAILGPLVFIWVAGGTFLVFLAWPARYAWFWFLCRPLLRERWLDPRHVAVSVALLAGVISLATLVDLYGLVRVHPGWFVLLEAWQAPTYSWLGLSPRWYFWMRPDYLWIASSWTLVEGAAATVLLWRWRPVQAEATSEVTSGT
jgi:hypothetical protein